MMLSWPPKRQRKNREPGRLYPEDLGGWAGMLTANEKEALCYADWAGRNAPTAIERRAAWDPMRWLRDEARARGDRNKEKMRQRFPSEWGIPTGGDRAVDTQLEWEVMYGTR